MTENPIIVTGASDGIGQAIALELSEAKYSLILLGRNNSKLQDVGEQCRNAGAKSVATYVCDLTDSVAISEFEKNIKTKFPKISGLINNAGIWQKKGDLDEIPEAEILNVINTNLTGMILLTRKVLPLIRKAGQGFIINISSRSGYSAQQGQSIYSASKYGVRGFTEVLREDLKEQGIRVAGVYQGGTNTQMFNKAGNIMPEEKLATFIPTQELAKVVAFMTSRPNTVWLPEVRIENK